MHIQMHTQAYMYDKIIDQFVAKIDIYIYIYIYIYI
jgi:hypothetical protein